METPYIRIKFAPLLQQSQNDSKCCLEIIPEVSCIQNLDKIEWKQEEDFIEYVIPMTYKVKFKKQEQVKDDTINLNKTYHSCVDLIDDSSLANINLASGDVPRIISDTFILTKVITDYDNYDVTSPNNIKINENNEEIHRDGDTADVSQETLNNETVVENTSDLSAKEDVTETKDSSKEEVLKIDNCDETKYLLEQKSIELVNNYNGCDDTHIDFPNVKSAEDSLRKLSLSPICSVNTDSESLAVNDQVFSNPLMFRVLEPEKYISLGKNTYSNKISNKTLVPNTLIPKRSDDENKLSLNHYTPSERILPELRVAYFKKLMANEILPLEKMLKEIIDKCSPLGFPWRQRSGQNCVIYKNVANRNDQTNQNCNVQKQSKSNRVVYSIVFNE